MARASWSQLARASVMSACLAVIAMVGGTAMLGNTSSVSDATTPRAVPHAMVQSVDVGGASNGTVAATSSSSGARSSAACSTATPTASAASAPTVTTTLELERVDAPAVVHDPKHLLLLGTLTEQVSGRPVTAPVTLWRKLRAGSWKKVLSHRMTSGEGIVLLDVDQSGAHAVYKLTFDAESGFGASASPELTVIRK